MGKNSLWIGVAVVVILAIIAHFTKAFVRAALYVRKGRDAEKAQVLLSEHQVSLGSPLPAEAYSNFFYLRDLEVSEALKNKRWPSLKGAEQVREIAGRRRTAEKLSRIYQSQLEFYETMFPWLAELKGEQFDELVRKLRQGSANLAQDSENEDPVAIWVPEAKFKGMSSTKRNQLALDRYWEKKKTPWEVGRDYERFIGYKYENDGWHVDYQGIIQGFDDLGRDLIARKGNEVEIVQCKHWSSQKQIHEKHIFQLYETVIAFKLDNPGSKVKAKFVTSTLLSYRAKQFAEVLHVSFDEQEPLTSYPCIKCNIGNDGSKIYHLPFDQQYNRTVIEIEKEECYVDTVKKAEKLGFRRAYRWRGPVEVGDG